MHFGAGRLGFGLVLPALENASSPYVILNRPSAVWTPVIDREKETQQHVGVKVRARSNASSFLARRWFFTRGPRLGAARRVHAMITEEYGATGANIAVQDGIAAGQSVPHAHVHVLPRR